MSLLRRSAILASAMIVALATACSVDSAGAGGAGGSPGAAATAGSGPSTSASGPSATAGTSVGTGAGGGPSCASLPSGPITPAPFVMTLDGSEDLAFDGKGHLAAKKGTSIVLVDAMGTETHLADLSEGVFGLRWQKSGSLVAAVYGQGKLVEIAPDGQVSDWVSGLGLPNGVYPDAQGNVWVTETSADEVVRIAPDKSKNTIVASAPTANGIVLDEARQQLFFTDYGAGKILRVDPSGGATPIEVATVVDAKLDGLVMDECGNVYAVDQGNSRLYRVELDASGDAIGEPKLLATFPKNVANAQFGSGPGFSRSSLYVTGTPGTIYALDVGVRGAPVVTPP